MGRGDEARGGGGRAARRGGAARGRGCGNGPHTSPPDVSRTLSPGNRREERGRRVEEGGAEGERAARGERAPRTRAARRTPRPGHTKPPSPRVCCASACSLRRCGVDLWRLEGVVGGEVDVQEKDAALIRRLLLRSAGGRGQAVRPSAARGPASRREDRTGPIMVDCQ